jgi:glutamyl-tRNA reductase
VKELAGMPGGHTYAEALRELFDLDPAGAPAAAAVAVETTTAPAVTQADVVSLLTRPGDVP